MKNNDHISRKAAADELRAYLVNDNFYEDDENVMGYNDGIKRGLDVILDLDAVDANEWIPCRERLPDSFNGVLVSCRGSITVAFYDGCRWAYGRVGPLMLQPKVRPEAWMPLPEPYVNTALQEDK